MALPRPSRTPADPGGRTPGRPRLDPLTVAILAVAAVLVSAVAWHQTRGPESPAVALAPPADGIRRAVVFLGDSITSGHGLPLPQTFPLLLGVELAVPVVNAGISGDTTAGARRRLAGDVLAHRPRLVIVELGANDVFRRFPREETVENLRAIVRQVRADGAAVLLLHLRLPAWGQDGYRADLRALAAQEGAGLEEDVLEGIVPELTTDGLHPDREGHARLARRLAPALRRLLGTTEGNGPPAT